MEEKINDIIMRRGALHVINGHRFYSEESVKNCLQEAFGLLPQPVVSGSLSFKEQMKQNIIPRVWLMAEKEKEHLSWLIDNNAPKDMIETSQRYLSHFRQRHKEYIEYADGL